MAKRRRRKRPAGVPPRWGSEAVNTGSRMTPVIMPLMHGRVTGWSFRQEVPRDAVDINAYLDGMRNYYLEQEESKIGRVLVLRRLERSNTSQGVVERLSEYNRAKLLEVGHHSEWVYFSGQSWHLLYENRKKDLIEISCEYRSRKQLMMYRRLQQVRIVTRITAPPQELKIPGS